MSSDNNKLIATAVGAAIAGAAAAVATIKLTERRKERAVDKDEQFKALPLNRTSFIFEDTTADMIVQGQGTGSIVFPHNHEERMRRKIAARAAVEEDNFLPRNSVTVRVPATSANMGPGCT